MNTHSLAAPRRTPVLRLLSTLALLVAGLVVFASTAHAQRGERQQGPPNGERLEQQMTQLTEALSLTDAQATQVRAILAAPRTERGNASERRSMSREERQAQREQQQAETNAKIEALLTPEQVTSYRAWVAAQQANRSQRGGRRGGGS